MTTTAQLFAQPVSGIAGFNTTSNVLPNWNAGLGLSNVNPVTGHYVVQFVPSSALNSNGEGLVNSFIGGNYTSTPFAAIPQNLYFGQSYGYPTSILSQGLPVQQNLGYQVNGLPQALGFHQVAGLSPAFGSALMYSPFGSVNAGGTALQNTGIGSGADVNGFGAALQNTSTIQQGFGGQNSFSSHAAFVAPSGWQNIPAKIEQHTPFATSTTQGLTSAAVRYISNDTETVIECYIPGTNTENLELVVIGHEIRVRQLLTGQTEGGNTGAFLSLALPHFADGALTQAQALGEVLRITCPTRKEIVSHIKKIKPSRAK